MDSLAVAVKLKDDELHSLYVHTGVPAADAQAEAARKIADKYCASHKMIVLHDILVPPTETGRIRPMYYNTPILAILGAAHAASLDIVSVVSGNKIEVFDSNFEKYMAKLLSTTKLRGERMYSRPLGKASFDDIYQIVKDDELLDQTVSCLSVPPCGICAKCKNRQKYNIGVTAQ